jgi:hypothetical protein
MLAAAGMIAPTAAAGDDGNAASPPLPAAVRHALEQADRAFRGGDAAKARAAYGRVPARVPDGKPAMGDRTVASLRLGPEYRASHGTADARCQPPISL